MAVLAVYRLEWILFHFSVRDRFTRAFSLVLFPRRHVQVASSTASTYGRVHPTYSISVENR